MRELYIWSKAKHENVHELMGIIMFQDRLGMVSPWMENGNLQEYIQKSPAVDRYKLVSRRLVCNKRTSLLKSSHFLVLRRGYWS